MEPMEQFIEFEKSYNNCINADTKTRRAILGSGVWTSRGRTYMVAHKKENAYLVMCHNTPFLEIHHNHFILIAPPPDSVHYTNNMNAILNAVLKTKGDKRYFFVRRRLDPRLNMRVCFYRGKRFLDHCILNEKAEVIYTDFDKARVEVDTEKVKEMRKKIRNYFKPYEVLVRLQSAEKEIEHIVKRPWHDNVKRLCDKFIVKENDQSVVRSMTELQNKALELIAADELMNIELTTLITISCAPHSRKYYDYKTFLGRVKKTRDTLRLRFTQGCTKVMFDKYIPEEAYVKYKGLVLQQIDGLRSLQVPSEAEVSGQDTGAIPATA